MLPAYNSEAESIGAGGVCSAASPPAAGGPVVLVEPVVVSAAGRLCMLTPGDSPIGFRIPTESMPWVAPDELSTSARALRLQIG